MISLKSEMLRYRGVSIANPYHIDIPEGVCAVVGPNGCGKSSLGKIIESGWNYMTNDIQSPRGKLKIKILEFSDIHALAGYKAEYYQQRYESGNNDEVPTVADMLGDSLHDFRFQDTAARLGLKQMADKRLNHLSSGELRKMLVANMMRDLPDMLILDNPYIGLDVGSRQVLSDTLAEISRGGTSVLLLIGSHLDIPECVDAIIPMSNMQIGEIVMREGLSLDQLRSRAAELFDFQPCLDLLPLRTMEPVVESDMVVEMHDCQVRYGKRVILNGVNWTVRRGEQWLLTGPNGSGKSTLLSLVNADNPQGYSNDIALFGRSRGTGESIWDIKRRIGYVSPEMHLYFNAGNNSTIEVIAGGLSDTLGCFRRIPESDMALARRWSVILDLEACEQHAFNCLSFGQQRMVLLARALIKNPEFLILDEPLHGLDYGRKQGALRVIEAVAAQPGTTLVFVTHCADEILPTIDHNLQLS